MKIFRNPWIEMSSEQFSLIDQVKTYPEMHSLCLLICLGEISLAGCVRAWPRKIRKFHENSNFLERCQGASRKLLGCLGSFLECFWVSRSDFRMFRKTRKKLEIRTFFLIFFTFWMIRRVDFFGIFGFSTESDGVSLRECFFHIRNVIRQQEWM